MLVAYSKVTTNGQANVISLRCPPVCEETKTFITYEMKALEVYIFMSSWLINSLKTYHQESMGLNRQLYLRSCIQQFALHRHLTLGEIAVKALNLFYV